MMKVDIETLAHMYGVSDMYTQLRIMQEDGEAFILLVVKGW